MKQNLYISVPFKTESGLSQVDGMAKFSSAGIVLEFESKLFGIIKDGVKEARIAIDEILDVKFRKGFFKYGAKIEIRLKDFTKLSKLPNKDGKITLKIKKDDFERAQEAVAKMQKDLTEQREFLPPTHTPVSRLFDESEEETKDLGGK
jgi:DNA modification methylase